MYSYRLHLEDGSDAGEATYAVLLKPGEEILVGTAGGFRVLGVVLMDDEDSKYVGLLQAEAAQRTRPDAGRRMAGCCA